MTSSSETARVCLRCGRTIPAGQECSCSGRPRYWLHSRETILLLSFGVLVVAFAVTGFAANRYHAQRRSLAEQWHARGASELAAGRSQAAVDDFESAMIYARENVTDDQLQAYQLDLAESLVDTGRSDEARSYLLDLWERAPGNSEINLDLARLAARESDDAAARRYYEGAIDGVWQGDSNQLATERFDARLEYYRYLAGRGDPLAAQSVLLAAAASLPPDSTRSVQVGQLMLDSGQAQQALALFQQALRTDAHNPAALAGAGLASFSLGANTAAVRYLEDASREEERKPQSSPDVQEAQQVSRTLAVARETLAIDPFREGLGAEERADRVMRSYNAALDRLKACAAQQGIALPKIAPKTPSSAAAADSDAGGVAESYERLAEMPPRLSDLVNRPGRVEQKMNLVFDAEMAADASCGAPQEPADAALDRLTSRTQGGRP